MRIGQKPGQRTTPTRLVAAATIAALRSLVDDPAPSREHGVAVLDEALTFLQEGLERLQRREPAA